MIGADSRGVHPSRAVAYLAIGAGPLDLGLEARRVLRVVDAREWDGPAPPDVSSLLVEGPRSPGGTRVLVVASQHGSYALTTGDGLRMRSVSGADVLAVPQLVWLRPLHASLVVGIAFEPDDKPLLVLDTDRAAQVISRTFPSMEGGGIA
jgi:hypothetical protein